MEHIDAYLAACQLGITLASLGLGVVGKPVFEELLVSVFGEQAAVGGLALSSLVAFSIITLLHVVIGELAPKSLTIANTAPVALVLAPPMRLFYLLTKPVVDAFNWMATRCSSRSACRPWPRPGTRRTPRVSCASSCASPRPRG